MKILKFTGQLIDIMGEDSRKNWLRDLGLKYHRGHQSPEDEITLMEVVDESKCQKYLNHLNVDVITPGQANQIIQEKMDKVTYKVTSEALMSANINKKVTENSLDLEKALPEWDDQQELEYLYNSGISGIKRIERVVGKYSEATKETSL
jgi:hypothetical protein